MQDATGAATAKVFSDVDRFSKDVEAGDFIRAEGRGSVYNGQVQLVLSTLRRVNPDQDRLQGFKEDECILSAPRPIDEMWADLQQHLQAVTDPNLRVLLTRIVTDNEAQLRVWPAAQQIHHAYRGGFLEHITKMAEVGAPGGARLWRERRPGVGRGRACTTSASCRSWPTTAAPAATRVTATWWATSRWA